MNSENYRQILNNAYQEQELSKEDFNDTLMHFAKKHHQEQTTTERSKEIVSKLLLDGFHATEGKVWADPNEYIYAAKDFGLNELAEEMENCLK